MSRQVEAKRPPAARTWLSESGDLRLTREEFPGWEIYCGMHFIWFARLRGAEPPLAVSAEELHVLRHRMTQAVAHRQRQARRP